MLKLLLWTMAYYSITFGNRILGLIFVLQSIPKKKKSKTDLQQDKNGKVLAEWISRIQWRHLLAVVWMALADKFSSDSPFTWENPRLAPFWIYIFKGSGSRELGEEGWAGEVSSYRQEWHFSKGRVAPRVTNFFDYKQKLFYSPVEFNCSSGNLKSN